MNIKNPFKYLKAPCTRCPYKLGLVRAIVNPCPQCRANGYTLFEQLDKRNSPRTSRKDD